MKSDKICICNIVFPEKKFMFALNSFLELKPLLQIKCKFYENATNSSAPLTPKVVYSIPLLLILHQQCSSLWNKNNFSSLHAKREQNFIFANFCPKRILHYFLLSLRASTYEKVSDIPESRVWFASKNLTPCRMH